MGYLRIIRLFLAGFAAIVTTAAMAAPRVIITIDVESGLGHSLPEQIDAVCQDGAPCGLMEIVRMQVERKLPGTHFLNVYEHGSWGDPEMREIVAKLQAAGQDVALHTHPQWTADPKRNGMHQYSLKDQTRIVADGVRLLAAWSGQPVVAHRAGDYAADPNTLKALAANGIRVDSSWFWGHPRSRLSGLDMPRNIPSVREGVLQIPVTVYERRERPSLMGWIAPTVTQIRKIDADWLLDENEARAAVDAVVQADLPYLVIFLHSFTFLTERKSEGPPVANRRTHAIFAALLDRVQELNLPVVTMRDLAAENSAFEAASHPDLVPGVDVQVDPPRYLWHAWKARKAGVLVPVGIAVAALLVLVAIAVLRIRRGSASRTTQTRRAQA